MIRFFHLITVFVAIVILHLTFYKTGLYGAWHWLDVPMHIFGGIFLGLVWLWFAGKKLSGLDPLVFLGSIVGFVLTFGVLWEIAEYVGWVYFSDVCHLCALYDPLIDDLLIDLTLDFVGAMIVAAVFWKKI